MLKAPVIFDEIERLRDLAEYQVMDTDSEPSIDELTRLAAEICGTPISLVSLLDSNRQWFKSKYGTSVAETPRDISFCGHAIEKKDLFVVSDARRDPRFSDNPLVVDEPMIGFYAAAPLISRRGFALGTLCVIDRHPRQLNSFQERALGILSRQIVQLFELRRTERTLSERIIELQGQARLVVSQQSELVQAARFSSFIEMASSIAHEVNNPLAIISGKCQVVMERLKKASISSKEMAEALLGIEQASGRISHIVKSLSQFAKRPDLASTEGEEIGSVLTSVLTSLGSQSNQVQVAFHGDTHAFCQVKRDEIAHAIRQLVMNSIEAASKSESKQVEILVKAQDSIVQLHFIDSGTGIDPRIEDTLLEPFRSTKISRSGVGLGLNVAYGLIHANAGSLWLDKAATRTTFIVELPRFFLKLKD